MPYFVKIEKRYEISDVIFGVESAPSPVLPQPLPFIADHPFIVILLIDQESVMFEGRVSKPQN